jgi:response regulator RpfG family c-di-GMP phosphodiesterase
MSTITLDGSTILIVDDNPNNLRVLGAMLEQAGFQTRLADNGNIALRSASFSPPDLILLDIRMPGMDGYELCRRLKTNELTHEIPIIFISALQEPADKITAFRAGGVDYITKPFQVDEVLARVHTHLQLSHMQRQLAERIEEKTTKLESANQSLQQHEIQYRDLLFKLIDVMARTVEKRDPFTAGHQHQVAKLTEKIAHSMGLKEERILGLSFGSTIHDLGKIQIPADILSRPGTLSETEYNLVKTHARTGFEIVKDIDFPWPVAQMLLQHHERLDGSGYPQGLKGDEILLEARIIAVADVAGAMASHRPYRPARTIEQVVDELHSGQGTRYDPDVVKACVSLIDGGFDIRQVLSK